MTSRRSPTSTYPTGLAVDPSGSLTIVDSIENQVDTWDGSGDPTPVAGNGTSGGSGSGGPAVDAELDAPMGVAVDSYGDLFFTDTGNNLVDEVGGGQGARVRPRRSPAGGGPRRSLLLPFRGGRVCPNRRSH